MGHRSTPLINFRRALHTVDKFYIFRPAKKNALFIHWKKKFCIKIHFLHITLYSGKQRCFFNLEKESSQAQKFFNLASSSRIQNRILHFSSLAYSTLLRCFCMRLSLSDINGNKRHAITRQNFYYYERESLSFLHTVSIFDLLALRFIFCTGKLRKRLTIQCKRKLIYLYYLNHFLRGRERIFDNILFAFESVRAPRGFSCFVRNSAKKKHSYKSCLFLN
jgi:hypothetical protein